ncbi:MAG: trypsin-like peptidase domain-containing protein [Syntrophomonas sp.]
MKQKSIKLGLGLLVLIMIGMALFSIVIPRVNLRPSLTNPNSGTPGSISEVAARVSPSIVGISNLNGSLADQTRPESSGSGVIVDKDGHIVTNYHVVEGAEKLIITLADGRQQEARLVGADPRTDLALVKIESDSSLNPAALGDSDGLLVGQQVIAIGNPLGLQFARSVTAGVISGLNRLLSSEEGFSNRLIQTDAAINPGNSGGALVDLNGQVVGINTVKIAAQGFEGMGFSIPSNQVKQVVQELQSKGQVSRPIMGIRILGEINTNQASYFNLPRDYGVVIEPTAGGPAEKAGLKTYDIICALNGEAVKTSSELQEKILASRIGQTVVATIIRLPERGQPAAELRDVSITLGG